MAISQTQRTELLQLLVAMFDAAPGSDVLDDLANGIDAGNTIEMYAANLINSTEFTGIYSRALTANEFATKFVANLLGSTIDAATTTEAVAFIEGRLNAGASRDVVILEAITALQAVPETDTTWGTAVAQLNNKVEVAEYFGTQGQFTGLTLSQMQAAISGVTSDDTTVTAKKTAIDAGTLDGVGAEGTTFTLTTGIDDVNGTTANDTIKAVQSATATTETFSISDDIDGGAGVDTLELTSEEGAAVNAATVTNVENLVYRATVAGGNLDLANFTSVTDLTLDRTVGATNFSGIATSDAVTFLNSTATMDTDVTYANVTGSSDAATVTLNGVTAGADIALIGAVETVTVATKGAASSLADLVLDAGTTTLNINADEKLTVATTLTAAGVTKLAASGDSLITLTPALANNIVTVDASAMTAGGLKATLGTSAAIKVTGGAGDDNFTTGAVLTTGTVDAGAGSDTLTVSTTAHITSTTGAKYTNFEKVAVANAQSVDLDNLSGITAVILDDTAAGATSATNLTATQAADVTFTDLEGAATIGVKGAATVGQIDTVNITVNDGDTTTSEANTAAGGDLTLADVEKINFTAVDDLLIAGTTNMTDWTNITVTGGGDASITSGAAALIINSSVNASSLTGTFTLDFSGATANGASITGSATNTNTITGSNQADAIVGGAKADTFTGGTGADVFTGGAGADTFVFGTNGAVAGTDLDKITDFASGSDILDFGAAGVLLTAENNGTTATSDVDTTAGGKISFATADDTFAEKVTAIQADTQLDAVNSVAFFEDSGNTFVYYAGAATGNADDQIVQLTGVTGLSTITINGSGDLTIA